MSKDKKVTGICKLCGNYGRLVKSHIYPQFFLRRIKVDLFEGKGKDLKEGLPLKPVKKSFTGHYATDMMCWSCEALIAKFDDYAAKIFFSDNPPKNWNLFCELDEKNSLMFYRNIDYCRMKLFFLSLVWRMHHASSDHFKDVDLGKHEAIIKGMINSGSAGRQSQYPIIFLLSKIINENDVIGYMSPRRITVRGDYTAYAIAVHAFIFIIFVTSKRMKDHINKLSLDEQGNMTISVISKEQTIELHLMHLGCI
jgi:hypothetical protein